MAMFLLACVAAPVSAAVFTTPDRALAEAFPGARIESRRYTLTPEQLDAVRKAARVRTTADTLTAHLAWHGDTLAGTAFFESRIVRTMPGVFMIAVSPETTVQRVEVIAFHEPPDFQPTSRWLDQFPGQRLDNRLWPRRDIRTLTGATLSTQAVTESVRQALAWYTVLVAPALRDAGGSSAPGGGHR
jgi:Na+-translocating ferredoxin:NAD+ oxidoreductase RnfG subunit